ncbi:hypothetical protein NDA13_005461 [Ustilago tritici]|nr:hypothetical protein NDA13_005461 [Ustilago tritici]
MSAAPKTIQEGTYKICFDEGCLTALGRDQPLVIMGIGQHEHQTWEVKKHDGLLVAVDESDHEFIMAQSSAVVYPPRVSQSASSMTCAGSLHRQTL